jgi:subtilisin family serine protease
MTFANKEDTLLVIAAGNDSANLQKDKNLISLPNEGAQGLSVAATGPEGFLFGDDGFSEPPESPASYTNYGTNDIVLGAPGGDLDFDAPDEVSIPDLIGDWVLSTTFETPDDEEPTDDDGDGLIDAPPSSKTARYGYKLGTSMAAPQVTGAAALVKSANPDYSANQVEAALKRAADVPDGAESLEAPTRDRLVADPDGLLSIRRRSAE